jgi:hypothetical protein
VNAIHKSDTRRQAERGQELAIEALELYRGGLSFRDVARRIDRSVSFTHRVIKRELADLAAQRAEIAGFALAEIVERERLVISESLGIALALCPECQDSWPTDAICTACKGTRRAMAAKLRLEALDRVRRSDEVLMRLYGIGVVTASVTVDAKGFDDDLQGMSDEALERFFIPLSVPLELESS